MPPECSATHPLHTCIILSDSALPIGSFAFSAGLESTCLHGHVFMGEKYGIVDYLMASLVSVSRNVLPYVTYAWKFPHCAAQFDDDYDANASCSVLRRSSTAQGNALMTVFFKSFQDCAAPEYADCASAYKAAGNRSSIKGHFCVSWGLVCRCLGLGLQDCGYLFVFNHVKTLLSAAIRQGIIGPYQAQSVLASTAIRSQLQASVKNAGTVLLQTVGQAAPPLDIYQGRHEILYSRVFNS